MTDPRWTPDTEELVARVSAAHESRIRPHESDPTHTRAVLTCYCGGFGPVDLTKGEDWIPATIAANAASHAKSFRAHRAQAILTALADAGVLLPPGGETREEQGLRWTHGSGDVEVYARPNHVVDRVVTRHVPVDGYPTPSKVRRTVLDWADGSRVIGPWLEVTETSGDQS